MSVSSSTKGKAESLFCKEGQTDQIARECVLSSCIKIERKRFDKSLIYTKPMLQFIKLFLDMLIFSLGC